METRAEETVRRRRRTTAVELEILEEEFSRCDKPSIGERERISDHISHRDTEGPGMNAREIQVWFQNKRKAGFSTCDGVLTDTGQAMRRAQGHYPHYEQKPRNDEYSISRDTSSGSLITSQQPSHTILDLSQDLPTPKSCVPAKRRAKLVLMDNNGHAEVMFSPTPLKPSSPPRRPVLITPMKTPLSRKIAARSASSPALLPSSPSVLNTSLNRVVKPTSHDQLSRHSVQLKRIFRHKIAGKENIPPHPRDIRRIQSDIYEGLRRSPVSSSASSSTLSDERSQPDPKQSPGKDKMSAEECALSLVGLAQGK